MALDTRNKRSSAIHVLMPWRGMYPIPDGTVVQADRQAVALLYSGIQAGEAVAAQAEEFSGGWPIEWPRRKTKEERDEEIRQQRIRLGILPDESQPVDSEHAEAVNPRPKVIKLRTPEPWRLSDAEIERLRQRITDDIDLEIAVYLREIEKRKRQMLALVLILDSV